jgi:hypothetical protein
MSNSLIRLAMAAMHCAWVVGSVPVISLGRGGPPDARKLVRRHSEELVVCRDNRETVVFMATVRM